MATGSQRFTVHLARVIVLSDCADPTLKRPTLPAFPWELELIVQGSHCSSMWSWSHFYSEYTRLARSHSPVPWTLTPSQHILLPPLLRVSPPLMCTPRVGPGCVLWPVLSMSVSLRIHCFLLISCRPMPNTMGLHHAESQGYNRQVPCLWGQEEHSFVNKVALCYSTLTTGILSLSYYNAIFVV